MTSTVTRQDPRYPTLHRGKNARFPRTEQDAAGRIVICENVEEVIVALQRAVDSGLRPTVRSGGHCYEDFVVNNPNGVIVDVSLINHATAVAGGGYRIGPGAMLGAIYTELYRKYNVTIPAGSCYSVGAGGHLTGGGYGLLTRLQGLSVDWITGMDVVTVEANGKAISRNVNRLHNADLFRALLGSGGGNYGAVTNFYFERLPPAPRSLSSAGVAFSWDEMTEERFTHICRTYGEYLTTRGQEEDTWPLFTYMRLTHRSAGGSLGISAVWHDMDGKGDLTVPTEFLDRFLKCGGAASVKDAPLSAHSGATGRADPQPCLAGEHRYTTLPWIDATIQNGGGAGANSSTRGKYKSCYMKKNFTPEELRRMYAHLSREMPGVNTGAVIAVDSYGGAMNKPHLARETAIPQRASAMKLQYMMYWQNPEEDEARLKYFDELYTDIYSANVDAAHAGTPFHNELYEGCYINYPDIDMLRYPFWPELYYGQDGLYPFLQAVKKKYDLHNVFHHAMTVRT